MPAIRNSSTLVIGSGLHHEILQHEAADSPLANWSILLKLAWKAVNGGARITPSTDNTLTWERMVSALAYERRKPVWMAELSLRRAVSACLKDAVVNARLRFENHWLIQRLRSFHGDILCLNFDNFLEQCLQLSLIKCSPEGNRMLGISTRNVGLLFDRWISRGASSRLRLWHPHGYAARADSIRLGLRDYGAAPNDYREAFMSFKRWEREITGRRKRAESFTTDQYQQVIHALDAADKRFEDGAPEARRQQPQVASWDHWITRFMLRPVTFIGTGLSRYEFGLRWLLVQRERNFARVDEAERPPLRILRVGKPDENWADYPFEAFAEAKTAWVAL